MSIERIIRQLPTLGVGVTYCPELHEFITDTTELIQVVEIEPQTLWLRNHGNLCNYSMPQTVLNILDTLPQRKIIHSVGVPVGGNVAPGEDQMKLLKKNIDYLKSPWASEHLSFNSTLEFSTGFFLPPRQTEHGVNLATRNINNLQKALSVPLAVETGVNYLQPREDEMEDGYFVNLVSSNSDCGILLDLHNLYTNQLNHRQSIDRFLSQISLDRVMEVHLAGGIEMDGYWLDAHSGVVPEALIEISKDILPHLVNLKAVIFEILPSYIPLVGMHKIRRQLEKIRGIWDISLSKTGSEPFCARFDKPRTSNLVASNDTNGWEQTLSKLAIGMENENDVSFRPLQQDKGVLILKSLICEFRASVLVSMLKLTSRYLMLTLGVETFQLFLKDFWEVHTPRQFGSDEAANFIKYLRQKEIGLPILYEILDFEEAVILTLIDGRTRTTVFSHNPFPLMQSLFQSKFPEGLGEPGTFEIEVTPEAEVSFGHVKTLIESRMITGH